jgi:hypothetical protein
MRKQIGLSFCLLVIAGCGSVKSKSSSTDMAVPGDLAVAGGGGDLSMPAGGGDLADNEGTGIADAGPSCTSGMPCTFGGGNGLCVSGACVACTDPTSDSTCVAVYGAGNKCISGTCVVAACRTSADCGGLPCLGNHQCAAACTSDASCPVGQICDTSGDSTMGQCVANSCANTTGTACSQNASDLCCSGTCSNLDCCPGASCTVPGTATTGTCDADGRCITASCPSPSPTVRYVDPSAAGTNGFNGSLTCPYKLILPALQDLASGGTVIVKSGASFNNVTAARIVPAGVTIAGSDSSFAACSGTSSDVDCTDSSKWPKINITGNAADGFSFYAGSGALRFFTLSGPGATSTTYAGVWVQDSPSGKGVTVDHVTITGFSNGIAAAHGNTSGGNLTINAGVTSTSNNYGLSVTDDSVLTIKVDTGKPKTSFDSNAFNGIYIAGNGTTKVSITGPTDTSLIEANNNGYSGIVFYSTDATPSSLTGVTVSGNGGSTTSGQSTGKDGLEIQADSHLKVRYCTIANNKHSGVNVHDNGSDQVQYIDFGTCNSVPCSAGTSVGNNSILNNTQAGICVQSTVAQKNHDNNGNAKMPAEGNSFAWANGAQVDCIGNTMPTVLNSSSCAGSSVAVSDSCYSTIDHSTCVGMYHGSACQSH